MRRLFEGGAYLSKCGILYANRDALEFGSNEFLRLLRQPGTQQFTGLSILNTDNLSTSTHFSYFDMLFECELSTQTQAYSAILVPRLLLDFAARNYVHIQAPC